jgi:hypothetical protein
VRKLLALWLLLGSGVCAQSMLIRLRPTVGIPIACPDCGSQDFVPIFYFANSSRTAGVQMYHDTKVMMLPVQKQPYLPTLYCCRCKFEWIGLLDKWLPKAAFEKLGIPASHQQYWFPHT